MRPAPAAHQLPPAARAHLRRGAAVVHYAPYATTTWRLAEAGRTVAYLKAGWSGSYPTLPGEQRRCLWLRERGLPVPEVLDAGGDGSVDWLLTAAMPGRAATAGEYLSTPSRTVPALAEGLRALHEVDPRGCPFDAGVAAALRHVADRVGSQEVDPAGFHDEFRHLSPAGALARLRRSAPASEDLVICHGDYCLPNVLLADGRVSGYLDLGEAGVADRWRDLAVATWSVTWNIGPGHEDRFLAAYGADLDLSRRDFYRLLYDLES